MDPLKITLKAVQKHSDFQSDRNDKAFNIYGTVYGKINVHFSEFVP